MWQEFVRPHVEAGKLVAIGVVQEQHPDRAALYAQWRRLDWPLYVDTLNTLPEIRVVPIPMGLDAQGVVREPRLHPRALADFVETVDPGVESTERRGAQAPDLAALEARAERASDADAWLAYGTAAFHFGRDEDGLTPAIDAFRRAITLEPEHGPAHFRLAAVLRRRHESPWYRTGDAQAAIDHWVRARAIDPNHYIWWRRIQQYGPRLAKPYDFYSWVEEARRDIRARGEEPHPLSAEPAGSELLGPRGDADADADAMIDRDPGGRIARDDRGLIAVESMVTPHPVTGGERARVRWTFRPASAAASWNNEADELTVFVRLPSGFTLQEPQLTFRNPEVATSREVRHVEFEVAVDAQVRPGAHELEGYALYHVCEEETGICRLLRRDLRLTLSVGG